MNDFATFNPTGDSPGVFPDTDTVATTDPGQAPKRRGRPPRAAQPAAGEALKAAPKATKTRIPAAASDPAKPKPTVQVAVNAFSGFKAFGPEGKLAGDIANHLATLTPDARGKVLGALNAVFAPAA